MNLRLTHVVSFLLEPLFVDCIFHSFFLYSNWHNMLAVSVAFSVFCQGCLTMENLPCLRSMVVITVLGTIYFAI